MSLTDEIFGTSSESPLKTLKRTAGDMMSRGKRQFQFKDDVVAAEMEGVQDYLRDLIYTAPDPVPINSVRRDLAENSRVGGEENSYHLSGDAVDAHRLTPENLKHFKEGGMKSLFHKNHYHLEPGGERAQEANAPIESGDLTGELFGSSESPWQAATKSLKKVDSGPTLTTELFGAPDPEPMDPNQGVPEFSYRKAIVDPLFGKPGKSLKRKKAIEWLNNAAPKVNQALGLDTPVDNKALRFLQNVNRGIVDFGIGFPASGVSQIFQIPDVVEEFREDPKVASKELVSGSLHTAKDMLDPREYTAEKFYEDPVGRVMNLLMFLGMGAGGLKNLKARRQSKSLKKVPEADWTYKRTPEEMAQDAFAERRDLRFAQEELSPTNLNRPDVIELPGPGQSPAAFPRPRSPEGPVALLPERASPSIELAPVERMPVRAREPQFASEGQVFAEPQPKVVKGGFKEKFETEIINRLGEPESKVIKGSVPEAPQTIKYQMEALQQKRVPAVLVTEGTAKPKVPQGYREVQTQAGTFIYDPMKIGGEAIKRKVNDGTYGEILGHVEPKGPNTTEVVTAQIKGKEAKSSLVSPENIGRQAEVLKGQFPEAEIRTGGPELGAEVLKGRGDKTFAKAFEPEMDISMGRKLEGEGVPNTQRTTYIETRGDKPVGEGYKKTGKLTRGKKMYLDWLEAEIKSADAGKRIRVEDPFSNDAAYRSEPSTFPIENLGSKAEQLRTIKKVKKGKKLTENQEYIYGEMSKWVEQKRSQDAQRLQEYRRKAKMKSNGQLLKEALKSDEMGAVGDVSKMLDDNPAARERLETAKVAREELFNRVKVYAKKNSLSLEAAMAKLKIDPVIFKKTAEVVSEKAAEDTASKYLKQPEAAIARSGLDTGKRITDRKSYNPEKIGGEKDLQRFYEDIANKESEFADNRISKSNEDIKKLADLSGVTPEQLMEAKPGSITNAETAFRARELDLSLTKDLMEEMGKVDSGAMTDVQRTSIKKKYLKLMAVKAFNAGNRSEAAHLFRQYQMKVHPREEIILDNLVGEMKRLGLETKDVEAFSKKSRELVEPGLGQKAWHLWYSSILSGPATHLRNVLGNASQMALELSRVAATQPQELPSALRGLYRGFFEGAKEAKGILKDGSYSKFEESGMKPIRFKGKAKMLNAFDYVGRALEAMDVAFREPAKGMEAMGQARGQAVKEGLKGKERKARMDELYPEKLQTEEVQAFGRRMTYTQKPAGVMGALSDAVSNTTRKVGMGKLVAPFSRIVANVVNNGLDWTPAGIYRAGLPKGAVGEFKTWKGQEYQKGRTITPYEIKTGRQRYQQLGRGVMGTVGMVYFAQLASEGRLSGNGPKDWGKRNQLISAGWRPNSIKIGDKYVPYQYFGGPLAIPMAIVGNYFDSVRYGELKEEDAMSRLSAALLGTANSVMDMSFLSGVSEIMNAMGEWQTRGGSFGRRFVAQQASSVVPNFFKQIARVYDPTIYKTDTVLEKIKSYTRFTSGLKPAIDIWGDERKGDAMSGLQWSAPTKDPVKRFLLDNELWVKEPGRSTTIEDLKTGERRRMTDDELYTLIKHSGPEIKKRLLEEMEIIKSANNPEEKQEIINDIVNDVRKQTKEDMILGVIK